MTAVDDPLVGRTIAQYEIVARIGGGAMGVVYQARDTKLARLVALKFLPQQWSHDETARQRFVREAQAASATNHPNICTIHDIATASDGQLFIVMAFYEGPTLKQRIDSGRLGTEEALDIATQMAEGLAKAHAQGVVHRDVKPGNVILTEEGVRILDFGLATFVDALKLTAENTSFGTPAYMSPEQVRGRAADARSDVWAVGVVLYEMLAGHVPFHGGYAEAVAHAILHEAPAPLRSVRPDVPEAIEQLVFRALHKEPSVRYQSGRGLARALRQGRGLSVPLDLRTEPVAVVGPEPQRSARRTQVRRRTIAVAAAIASAALIAWLWWPVERVLVAIVPVMNQTGYSELDAYRFALTEALESQVTDRPSLRVFPHDELLQVVQRFRQEGRDPSGREALQAIASSSGARLLVIPTLLRDNGGWKVRIQFREPETGTIEGGYDTAPVVSSLMKDAVYGLIAAAARGITTHVVSTGPRRAAIRAAAWRAIAGEETPRRVRFATLDAAASFEQGLNAYEQFEYAAARSAFTASAARDPRNPLPLAWQSRAAAFMRQDKDAVDAAERAIDLVGTDTSVTDRLFVEAVAFEARRDLTAAEQRYRDLIARHPDEAAWLVELAAFQDRQAMSTESVASYHAALAMNSRLVRPHLELCRLYGPYRLNESALARRQGEQALSAYASIGHESGRAQAFWCLSDVLLFGNADEHAVSRQHAEAALEIMKRLKYPFGIARGYNYLANVALFERKAAEAAALWTETLAAARSVGFVLLESRTLMNLGVANEALGKRSLALKYYQESAGFSEALGSQLDAMRNQVNAASILVEYGGDPDEGFRMAQDSLPVIEKLVDKNFEVSARRVVAMYYRNVGRYEDALREFTRARDIARERDLEDRVTQMTLELARVRFEMEDYLGARDLLTEVAARGAGLDRVHARIERARVHARLGDVDAARTDLSNASMEMKEIGDVGTLPLLYGAGGEVEYEAGRLADARSQFDLAAQLWTDEDPPEAASVEGRAYVGLIDGVRRQALSSATALEASLARARTMKWAALEARVRVFLARLDIDAGRFNDALRRLGDLPADSTRALGPELRAQVHYWRGLALSRRGDAPGAAKETTMVQQSMSELRRLVTDAYWPRVLSRPEIRLLTMSVGQ